MGSRRRFETIDEYIGTFPKKTRSQLGTVRRTIRQTVPEAEETISYQIPTFKLDGKYLVYFAGFKNHISIYPFSSAMGESIKEASRYETSVRGTIRLLLDKPLPIRLIRKIVKYRVKERKVAGSWNSPKKKVKRR